VEQVESGADLTGQRHSDFHRSPRLLAEVDRHQDTFELDLHASEIRCSAWRQAGEPTRRHERGHRDAEPDDRFEEQAAGSLESFRPTV